MTLTIDASYQLGTFRDNTDALRRLKRQASIALDLEFGHLETAGLSNDARVLDLGCGPGVIAAEIASRYRPRRLLAGDCNDTSLAEARLQLDRAGFQHVEVKHLNVYDRALGGEGEFDFIYSRFLLQHLSDPIGALSNVRACLSAQGRFCACDIDDRWLASTPAIPEFSSFIARAGRTQAARGGDRTVGLKLPRYFQRAGFDDIRCSVLLLTTDLVGKDAFCDLVFGYKLDSLADAELEAGTREASQIRQAIHAEHGWAAVSVFFVSGGAPTVAEGDRR